MYLTFELESDGFKRIWDRLDILNWFSKFDIIAINQTWCNQDCDIVTLESKLDYYKCFYEPATRVSKYGRPSGGIAVYVRNQFENYVARIDAGFKFAVIIELKDLPVVNCKSGSIVNNVILVCTYLPPKNSTAYGEELDGIVVLRGKLIDLKLRYPDHKLVVAGDLNARVKECCRIL